MIDFGYFHYLPYGEHINFKALTISMISRGGENRTPTKGFGDPYDTTSPHPYLLIICIATSIYTHYVCTLKTAH